MAYITDNNDNLVRLPSNQEDFQGMYEYLASVLIRHGESSNALGYLSTLYEAARKADEKS